MTEFHFSPRPNRAHEIRWSEWEPETFARAAAEDKPILLGISAVWCHWCHVMDETTYSDPGVIAAINERFIPIRVDNDVRPDVNARYNMGGWPTTAFLAPDGMTITGATYLRPDQMRRALDDIAQFYASNKDDIAARAVELRDHRRSYEPSQRDDLRVEMVESVAENLRESYDPLYGGFGEAPKFPQPEVHEFLLQEYRVTGDARLLEMVANTLRHMASGGTYDHVEGGFFRYSTTRDWSVPHFEKMSEDHAGLLRVLAHLAALQPDAWIRDAMRSATAYVRTVLRDPDSAFFAGSQDADEIYFAKSIDERRAMTAPFVDRRSYSNWTAAFAGALFAVARALDDDAIACESIATLDAMHENLRDADGLLYHLAEPGSAPAVRGLLGDQVAYTRALLDAHEHTGEARFLQRAVAHADATIAQFSASDGGFYDHAAMQDALGNLTIADRPIGDNGLFTETLLRLAALTGDDRFAVPAERTLLLFARTFAQAGSFGATYARALRRFLSPQGSVRIVGDPAATAELRAAALQLGEPFVAVRTVTQADAPAIGLPAAPVAAYACTGTTCGAPITKASELRGAFATLARNTAQAGPVS
jgi:uncharacterized protein YyaL (SSP411 family)